MPLQLSSRIPEPDPLGHGVDALDGRQPSGEPAQPAALHGAVVSTGTALAPVAGIAWLPDDVLRRVLDHLDGPSRRSFRATDRQASRIEEVARRADRMLAESRWSGCAVHLSKIASRLVELPVPYRPRVLDAVAARIAAVGESAMPALRTVIEQLIALPSNLRREATGAAILVLREWERPARTDEARDPALERCAAALVGGGARLVTALAVPKRETPASDAGENARVLEREAFTLASEVARADEGAGARFTHWLGRVHGLMPPSARAGPLKACALALPLVTDADIWAFGRVVASLPAEARADVLSEVPHLSCSLACFDVMLGLVADLPLSHRGRLLARLPSQLIGASGEEQVARIQALTKVAERQPGAVCTEAVLSLIMVMDSLHASGESLARQHADSTLARLTLSGKAALLAEAARQQTMASRLWVLSKLPELAEGQATHALGAGPRASAVIPYRAEILRRLLVNMARDTGMLRFELDQVWPALCEALEHIEEEATAFPVSALRELATHLPEPQRAQAHAIADRISA